MKRPRTTVWTSRTVAAAFAITAAAAVALKVMGRRLWCDCGTLSPWSWDIWSRHNSQHLLDPYTFTHVSHGVLLYALLWVLFRARRPALRMLLALGVEAVWEVAENTNAVIESYRESTISLNYYGDSILNSVADIAAFGLGYAAARRLPGWVSAVGIVAFEVLLVLTIRDSLLLNVVMLIYPVEAIKTWQMGG